MDELFQDFIQETGEHLETIEKFLLMLDENHEDRKSIDEIFRAIHTIKGTSAFLEFYDLADVTHALETLLQKIREEGLLVTDKLVNLCFEVLDTLKIIYENLQTDKKSENNYSDLIERLVNFDIDEESQNNFPLKIVEKDFEKKSNNSEENSNKDENNNVTKLNIDETIRIKVEKLNNVINLIGELVTINSGFSILDNELNSQPFSKLNLRQRKVLSKLRDISLSLRMLPISYLFNKFPRLVRDLSKKTGKKVKLILSGEETEIDKNIIEELYEPLLHLIRNSIDHGIEPIEMRRLSSKDETGIIKISASHHESHIIIEISDDGLGIDFDSVLRKAEKSGFISPGDHSLLSLDDVISLIFKPGLSTTEEVSEISGRGVGMDVVQSKIENLHGVIEVKTSPGVGTTFKIKLPLTLSIMQILMIRVKEYNFGIPLISVLETIKIDKTSIEDEPEYSFFILRNETIRLIYLSELLGLKNEKMASKSFVKVVVVGHLENKIGIIVDEFHGKHEVVLKPFRKIPGKVKGVLGASILGNGTLLPILELGTLIREYIDNN